MIYKEGDTIELKIVDMHRGEIWVPARITKVFEDVMEVQTIDSKKYLMIGMRDKGELWRVPLEL